MKRKLEFGIFVFSLFYFDHKKPFKFANGNIMVATCVGSDTRLAKELIRLLSAEIFNRVNFAYGKLPQVQVHEACSWLLLYLILTPANEAHERHKSQNIITSTRQERT
jgi:hypothetical protein